MLTGIDIAADNGVSAASLATDFGIVKCSESTNYLNPNYAGQIDALRSRGKKVGHYLFLHNGNADAQVAYFQDHLDILPGELVAVDVEQTPSNGNYVESYETALRALGLIRERLHLSPLFYSYPFYIQEMRNISSHTKYPWTDLTAYPLWIAEYNGVGGVSPADMFGWKVWTMHQDADKPIVDRDVFNGDVKVWDILAYPDPPKPPPPPKPPIDIEVIVPSNVHVNVKTQNTQAFAANTNETSLRVYKARPGDTIEKIAAHFNVSVDALKNVNPHISNPNTIFANQAVYIP